MLKLESGFPPEVFTSQDSALNGYANHHRLVMPSLIAPDTFRNDGLSAMQKIEQVRTGEERSRTMMLAKTALDVAHLRPEWAEIKAGMELDEEGNWRIQRRDDDHSEFHNHSSFSVTRTIARAMPGEVVPGDVFRLRERYTVIARSYVVESDVRDFFEGNNVDFLAEELLLASATVYALNKAVQKPQPPRHEISESFSQMLEEARARHATTRRH